MSLALPARAKLNLDLEVVGRSEDGYHEIRTTMQTIDLHDVLTVDVATETSLEVSGMAIAERGNSVLKAHDALERALKTNLPARFHLHKRIPPGSGMGGASSDAAAALRALKALFWLDVDLLELAPEIGSDVPFFVHDASRAVVEGRGERVTPIPSRPGWFAIAWPGIELSTRAVYQAWDEVKGHDLRQAAEQVEPRVKEFARRLGDGWRMTGSGSAFFKPAATEQEARRAIESLDCWTATSAAVA